ncbi:MAG: sigma-70 family RNA polymerase sigma factor [Myxococcales bacterium]|nr:sigma-70 family RNA polymerase sigma factor [Myxococcales bacterium]
MIEATEATDDELLQAWIAGDRRAGDRLVRRYAPRLTQFLSTKLEAHEIQDVIQLIWMGVLRARERFSGAEATLETSFRAYLYAIARNQLYRHYRKRARDDFDPQVSRLLDIAPSLSRVVASRSRERRLADATQQLPIDLQVMLEMHYVAELSCSEIAKACELPIGTVKSRLRRAKKMIEEELAKGPVSPS